MNIFIVFLLLNADFSSFPRSACLKYFRRDPRPDAERSIEVVSDDTIMPPCIEFRRDNCES